jgi:coxsackievirus/adenovirus receptor
MLNISYFNCTQIILGIAEIGKREDCFCLHKFDPVCGTDGNTYGNACVLECSKQEYPDRRLKVAYHGECIRATKKGKRAAAECGCQFKFAPVCGTNGKTYDNENCMEVEVTQCGTVIDSPIRKAHDGECKTPIKVQETQCGCPDNLAPVCGTDGNTYPNAECMKNEITKCGTVKSTVTIARNGAC